MIDQINRLRNSLKNSITRAKLAQTATLWVSRAVMQVNAFFGETLVNVELMQPYGMSSRPTPFSETGNGPDVLLLQVSGMRDHLVAIHCDDPALRIADLKPGEFGFRDMMNQQIVFRNNQIEITQPTSGNEIIITSAGDISMNSLRNISETAVNLFTITAPTVDVNGSTVVNIISNSTINLSAPNIHVGANGQTLHDLVTDTFQALFNSHTHPGDSGGTTGAPNQQLTSANLTSTLRAG